MQTTISQQPLRSGRSCAICGISHYKKVTCEVARGRIPKTSSATAASVNLVSSSVNTPVVPKRVRKRKTKSATNVSVVPSNLINIASDNNVLDDSHVEHVDPLLDESSDEEPAPEPEITPAGPIPDYIWTEINIPEPPWRVGHDGKREYTDRLPKFTGPPPGPINIPEGCTTPLGFFKLLFSDGIMDTFVNSTNAFAESSKEKYWQPLTPTILIIFFACILFMGANRKPYIRQHWSNDSMFESNFLKETMSRNLFLRIMRCIHWENTHILSANAKKARKAVDGFYQLSGFLLMLAANFGTYYAMHQQFDIDEMCIFFKGRHKCRCYNPSKPNKFHLKAFCVNDGSNGYCHNFYMYNGAAEVRPAEFTATVYPVYKLLASTIYHFFNYILSTDNWYTSLHTWALCRQRGMHCNGTVKANVKNLPKEGLFPNKGRDKKDRGTMKQMMATKDGEEVYFNAWMDSKPVHMLSSYKSCYDKVQRRIKTDTNDYQLMELTRPILIGDYNYGMKGTDLVDQKTSYYQFEHKTIHWPHRIIFHFLMTAVINSMILYTEHMKIPKMPILNYLYLLIKEMTEHKTDDDANDANSDAYDEAEYFAALPDLDVQRPKRRSAWQYDYSRLVKTHTPTIIHEIDGQRLRNYCLGGCGRRTRMKCVECGVSLCCEGDAINGCWAKFHRSNDI